MQGGQAFCFIQVFHILCWKLLKVIQSLHHLKEEGQNRAVWGRVELGGRVTLREEIKFDQLCSWSTKCSCDIAILSDGWKDGDFFTHLKVVY